MKRASLIGFALLLIVIASGLWRPWEETREDWIRKTKLELSQRPPPPADFEKTLRSGEWAGREYLLFENGWAALAIHTAHRSKRIGDVALLRTADGKFYTSSFHFCMGYREFYRPDSEGRNEMVRPRDLTHFLDLYGNFQGWKRSADL